MFARSAFVTEGEKTTRSNRLKFRLVEAIVLNLLYRNFHIPFFPTITEWNKLPKETGVWKGQKPESGIGTGMETGSGRGTGNNNGTGTVNE